MKLLNGLGYVDPMEAGKLIQRTKGTLRATEAWTDGHAEDDKHVELYCELAVALDVTEGAARSALLKWRQVMGGMASTG